MKNNKSIKRLFFNYLIFTTILPLFTIGFVSIIISYRVIKTELLEANDKQVELITRSTTIFLEDAETILLSFKKILDKDVSTGSSQFKDIQDTFIETHNFILAIQVSNLDGVVESIHPYDDLIYNSDISGYEYFKKTINSNKIYWSSSLISEITDSPVVSLSVKSNSYLITLFLSLEDISSLANYSRIRFSNHITITDQKGVYISHPDIDMVSLRENNPLFHNFKLDWRGVKIREITTINKKKYLSSIYFLDNINWMVSLNIPVSELYRPGMLVGIWLIVISLIILFIVIFLSTKLNANINGSFSELIKSSKEISGGNYDFTIPELKYSEFNNLSDSFLEMVNKVNLRENELREAHYELSLHKENLEGMVEERTKELNSTIGNLQLTQKQLVESEKMASLGELVAGISHEINTPVGIIVTGASYLEDVVKSINVKTQNGTLTKSDLMDFNENIKTSVDLILSNSRRASNLIQSFKQISADQTSEFRRVFNLKEYLEDIVNSLHPQYKNKNITINVSCINDLSIDSYPGAIAQVITNLVMNSLHHAFDETNDGEIDIKVTSNTKNITIIYSDTGKGMSKKISKKLFEPFFTTKRGLGGTGLGMHIVYNIVNQKLNGKISCISSPGHGVKFTIIIPIKKNI